MKVTDRIEHVKAIHLEKVMKLETLQFGIEWFMQHFGHVVFRHTDVRGGDVTPTVIMSTVDKFDVNQDALRQSFCGSPHYDLFKKHKLTVGTLFSSSKERYFYIQCNDDLCRLDALEQQRIMRNRMNSELFPHIEDYYE